MNRPETLWEVRVQYPGVEGTEVSTRFYVSRQSAEISAHCQCIDVVTDLGKFGIAAFVSHSRDSVSYFVHGEVRRVQFSVHLSIPVPPEPIRDGFHDRHESLQADAERIWR